MSDDKWYVNVSEVLKAEKQSQTMLEAAFKGIGFDIRECDDVCERGV